MRYLAIVNWPLYQHYHKRNAPWIKSYTDILDPISHPTFANLSDGAKLTLHHLRLLAGKSANSIPEAVINREHLNMKTPPKIEELIVAQFVEWLASDDASADASEQTELALAQSSDSASEPLRAPGRARSQVLDSSPGISIREEAPRRRTSSKLTPRDLVEGFTLTEKLRAWAAGRAPSVNVENETEDWKDHLRTNNFRTKIGPVADADASWRTWMKNAEKFNANGNGNKRGPSPAKHAEYHGLVDETNL